jgi:hypothetical protein
MAFEKGGGGTLFIFFYKWSLKRSIISD